MRAGKQQGNEQDLKMHEHRWQILVLAKQEYDQPFSGQLQCPKD